MRKEPSEYTAELNDAHRPGTPERGGGGGVIMFFLLSLFASPRHTVNDRVLMGFLRMDLVGKIGKENSNFPPNERKQSKAGRGFAQGKPFSMIYEQRDIELQFFAQNGGRFQPRASTRARTSVPAVHIPQMESGNAQK